MSQTNPSRTSLEDVLRSVAAAEMPPARRQDTASAVRTVARAIGRHPRDIEADPRMLGIRLKNVSAAALNLSQGRWNNVRSLLRQALKLAVPVMAGRSTTPLLEGWEQLMGQLADKRSRRIRLSRLVRWLSAHQIKPEDVTWGDLDSFRQAMMTDALLGAPEKTWTDIRRTWNLAMRAIPGWPQVPYLELSRKEVYVLPWSDFPATLKEDVDKWLDRLGGKDFAADGPARAARPATLETREYQLRAFASALVLRGRDRNSLTSLAACLSYENFTDGLRFFVERRGGKSTSTIHGMAGMLKGVAEHWCKVELATLTKMASAIGKLAVAQAGLTQKNRDRLRPLDDPEITRRLLNLPRILQGIADDDKVPDGRRRAVAQTALALEILLHAPLRAKNLVGLELDRHILKIGSAYHLVIPSEEVKNKTDLEFVLQGRSADLLDWYLQNHRRAAPGEMALFPGKQGAKSKGATAYHIKSTVQKYVGMEINMHLFRHIAAKIYLDANPGGYEVVRRVLGHKSMETTTNFYAGLETRNAADHFAGVVAGLRSARLEGVQQ
jgi:integrase